MLHVNNPLTKHKAGLLCLSEELGNASKECNIIEDIARHALSLRKMAILLGSLIHRSREHASNFL